MVPLYIELQLGAPESEGCPRIEQHPEKVFRSSWNCRLHQSDFYGRVLSYYPAFCIFFMRGLVAVSISGSGISVYNSQVFLEFVKTVHLVHALKEIWVPSLCILCIVIRCKCWCKYFKSSVFVIFIMTRESRTIFVALSSPDDQVLWVTWQWPNGFNRVSKKVKFRSA